MIRKPSVAGRFYPKNPGELRKTIVEFMLGSEKNRAKAIIAPHAGYIYSGSVAGAVYSTVIIPDDIILIGPNHTGMGESASVMSSGEWEIPTGRVRVDEDLAETILKSSTLFSADTAAHLMEHSLEVQLPFIHEINRNAEIAPITVMSADYDECEEMGQALASAIKAFDREVLIIVSSDMNHYEADKKTREKDRFALDRIMELDAKGLYDTCLSRGITMCGLAPSVIAIVAARELGAGSARLVKYATSGDACGDYAKVVGYASVIID